MISPDPDSHESVTAPVDSHLRGWLIIAGVLWAASLFGVWIQPPAAYRWARSAAGWSWRQAVREQSGS
jgi:hypothetical protein